MFKSLFMILLAFFLAACDAGLDSNLSGSNEAEEDAIDSRNKTLADMQRLGILGRYEGQLVTPDKKKTYPVILDIVPVSTSIRLPNGQTSFDYDARGILMLIINDQDRNNPNVEYTRFLKVIYDTSIDNRITFEGTSGGSSTNFGLFFMNGRILKNGFQIDLVYDHRGNYMPFFLEKVENLEF